jgi:L-ascorbate metabolism protein UlaG (beta-lactamase superfamily)
VIQPVLTNEALLADIRTASRNDHHFRLWWLGQSGFLLQWKGEHLLFDPYLSDSLTKKYAGTDKPHIRMTEIPVDPARLTFIDVCTSSHNHTDHLDAETLNPLRLANPAMKFIIAEANRAFVAGRLGCDPSWPIGLNDGDSVTVGAFHLSGVPAAHEQIERDEQGRSKFLGYVVKFGSWTVYHPGDTMLYEGMAARLRPYRVDLALLPVNGAAPERRVAGNLNSLEAAKLGKAIGARLVIPMHYDMFTFNTAPAADFAAAAGSEGVPYKILDCGERWSSESLKFK